MRNLSLRFSPALLTLAGLTALASAQTSPRENTRREGNSAYLEPFTTPVTPFRWLQVHDDLVGPRSIGSLSFRPDNRSNVGANVFTCRVTLSEAPPGITAANPGTNFASSHGANRIAHPLQQVSFAPSTYEPGELLPRRATMTIPLPQPYSLGAGARLVWDVEILTRIGPPSGDLVDGVRGSDPGMLYHFRFGAGCAHNSSAPPLSHALNANWNGGTVGVTMDAWDAPGSASVAFWLGAVSYLPPVALPNAPGCWLHVDPLLVGFAATADPAGFATVNLGAFLLPGASFNLYSQAAALAPSANTLGLITSNGHQVYLGLPTSVPPVGTLSQSALAQPVPMPNEGLVATFR